VSNQQFIAVKSIKSIKNLKQLELQLSMAHQSLEEKDKIIEGLTLDLAHLLEQLSRIQPNKFNKAH
jgi:hypothetical protein